MCTTSAAGNIEPAVATPPPTDGCLAIGCSRDCEGHSGSNTEVCGWDLEANECEAGSVTTAEEREALYESYPGGCSHHAASNHSGLPSSTATANFSAGAVAGAAVCGVAVGFAVAFAFFRLRTAKRPGKPIRCETHNDDDDSSDDVAMLPMDTLESP